MSVVQRSVCLFFVLFMFVQTAAGEPVTRQEPGSESLAGVDLQFRLFTRYQKGALTFGNVYESKNDVLVIYPAAVPAVGIGFQLNKNISGSWSVGLPKANFIDQRLRGSRFRHVEIHSMPSPFVFDAHYLRYEGLFVTKESKIDIRPFRDSLLIGNHGAKAYPAMTMESFSGGAIYNVDHASVNFGALLNQSTHPGGSGVARCIVSQIREARFTNDEPLDLEELIYSSGRMQAVALGPGFAAQYVDGDRYIGGVGFVAPAYSRSRLPGQNTREGFATFLNIRGTLGVNDGFRTWGLNGSKSLLTIDRRDVSMTDSVSSLELFYQAKF